MSDISIAEYAYARACRQKITANDSLFGAFHWKYGVVRYEPAWIPKDQTRAGSSKFG